MSACVVLVEGTGEKEGDGGRTCISIESIGLLIFPSRQDFSAAAFIVFVCARRPSGLSVVRRLLSGLVLIPNGGMFRLSGCVVLFRPSTPLLHSTFALESFFVTFVFL